MVEVERAVCQDASDDVEGWLSDGMECWFALALYLMESSLGFGEMLPSSISRLRWVLVVGTFLN
jgi:hypothetical protein